MSHDTELRAPRRGAYDRSLSRAERDGQQRERLLRAAAETLAHETLTVARVIQRAGVGRSTFYEFFDNPEHLLQQLEDRVLRALAAALEQAFVEARTPLERIRSLTNAWLYGLESHPIEAGVALRARSGDDLLSAAGKLLQAVLERASRRARLDGLGWFGADDNVSSLAAAAAVEVLSRRHISGKPLRDPRQTLADTMMKLLR